MDLNTKSAGDFQADHDFLVCIDSDGCAFDTMEIKHKECFCPATIDNWDLQSISSLAREAWEFVNLYSTTRGCSRFNAVVRVLDLLNQRPEVKARGFKSPEYDRFKKWVETAPILNNQAVSQLTDDPQMERVLRWSLDMNSRVAKMVHGIPPFPYVRESLEKLSKSADIVIVSATPREALLHEWSEHKIDSYVSLLGSQEDGTKKEIIAAVKDHYDPDKCLMIGDAPGDYQAALKNGILFYPIRPLNEVDSWKAFYESALQMFLDQKYKGEVQDLYYKEFQKCLPEKPSWIK